MIMIVIVERWRFWKNNWMKTFVIESFTIQNCCYRNSFYRKLLLAENFFLFFFLNIIILYEINLIPLDIKHILLSLVFCSRLQSLRSWIVVWSDFPWLWLQLLLNISLFSWNFLIYETITASLQQHMVTVISKQPSLQRWHLMITKHESLN